MHENEMQRQNLFAQNLNWISKKLKSGLSLQELEQYKDLPISADWRVKDLIEANLRTGYIKYHEGKFIISQSILSIRLTVDEEDILNQKALEAGLSAEELAENYISRGLTNH